MALRTALIGCGTVGNDHAASITASGSSIVTLFDDDVAASSAVARQTGARVAPTLQDAISAVGVDAVVVCLAGPERIGAISHAAEVGRPVVDTMPMDADAHAAIAAAEQAGILVAWDTPRRFDPGVRSVTDHVVAGDVGSVRSCRITDRDDDLDGEVALLHDLDLARHVVGSDIVDVAASAHEDLTVVVAAHADGTLTTIEHSTSAPAGIDQRIEVFGTDGSVNSATPAAVSTLTTAHGASSPAVVAPAVRPGRTEQWRAFATAVRRGATTDGAAADIAAALLAARCVENALTSRSTVRLAELSSPE